MPASDAEPYADASDLNTRTRIQERYRSRPDDFLGWLFAHLDLAGARRILELGCGSGALWLKRGEALPGGCAVTLTDASPGILADARRALRGREGAAGPYRFVVVDAAALPFPGGLFDAVIANGVYDAVPERARAFAEARRVLRAGGALYAATGGEGHLREIEELVRPFLPDADYGGDPHTFGLENGAEQLRPWFTALALHPYEDALVFREAAPIIAYVTSESPAQEMLVGETSAAFARWVQERLNAQGEIRVRLRKGLFVARR